MFTLLRDIYLPPNLVMTMAHYPSDVKKKKKKISSTPDLCKETVLTVLVIYFLRLEKGTQKS